MPLTERLKIYAQHTGAAGSFLFVFLRNSQKKLQATCYIGCVVAHPRGVKSSTPYALGSTSNLLVNRSGGPSRARGARAVQGGLKKRGSRGGALAPQGWQRGRGHRRLRRNLPRWQEAAQPRAAPQPAPPTAVQRPPGGAARAWRPAAGTYARPVTSRRPSTCGWQPPHGPLPAAVVGCRVKVA